MKRLLVDTALAVPGVLHDPPPEAFFISFGDSALNLSLFFWVVDYTQVTSVTDRINMAIIKSFKKKGIDIPYPNTDGIAGERTLMAHRIEIFFEERRTRRPRRADQAGDRAFSPSAGNGGPHYRRLYGRCRLSARGACNVAASGPFSDPVIQTTPSTHRLPPDSISWSRSVFAPESPTTSDAPPGRLSSTSRAARSRAGRGSTPRFSTCFAASSPWPMWSASPRGLLCNTLIQRFTRSWTPPRFASAGRHRPPTCRRFRCEAEGRSQRDRSGGRRRGTAADQQRRCACPHPRRDADHPGSTFATPGAQAERRRLGLGGKPTDVELEALAQTWSEHCKHKIFAGTVHYEDEQGNTARDPLPVQKLHPAHHQRMCGKSCGKKDFCLSVFKDNAGVIRFNDDWSLVFKVETHNSPSALDPYGGALTGIVGVNRDPFGTGMGAKLIFNTDVFCFADPFYDKPLPARLLHPRRIYEGVVEGVEHGGNKSGIPTVNGSLVFDPRFAGKPLVFCGTAGIMPAEINGKPSHEKRIDPGRPHRHDRRAHRQGRHPRSHLLFGGVERELAGDGRADRRPDHAEKDVRLPHPRTGRRALQFHHRQRRRRPVLLHR